LDRTVLDGHGPYVLHIQGELYHQTGSLLSPDRTAPGYAQLYFYDPAEARQHWMGRNNDLDPAIMGDLKEMLIEYHAFVPLYKQAMQIMREQPQHRGLHVRLTYKAHTDPQRYNLPTSDDIAVILPQDGSRDGDQQDIILHLKGDGLKRIHEGQAAYAPLHYVLLFPRGELGWHWSIPICGDPHLNQEDQEDPDQAESRKTVSHDNYYAYYLFQRENEATTILRGGKLLQQYVVDGWASIECICYQYILASGSSGGANLYYKQCGNY
jgi:hypothetical protein